MSGLVLKLCANERVLVNGAVIQNGDRRTSFTIVTPNAHVLRLRDAIRPGEVNTPVRRVCYVAQLVLSGDAEEDKAYVQLMSGIEQLSQVFTDPDSRAITSAATAAVKSRDFFRALKRLRELLPREARLLGTATAPRRFTPPEAVPVHPS